jgi:hypothetical protein
MITYIWTFNPLTCYTQLEGHEDVVMTIHWQLLATQVVDDKTYSAQSIGTTSLEFDASAESFIPFAELTKEVVQQWVETQLGEEQVEKIKLALETQIEEQITPKIVNHAAPWETPVAPRV